jgi:hypothetical protein
MTHFLILFIHDGQPRARLVRGSRRDAEHGLRLMRQKYSDGALFRIVEATDFEPISAIDEELAAYKTDLLD